VVSTSLITELPIKRATHEHANVANASQRLR